MAGLSAAEFFIKYIYIMKKIPFLLSFVIIPLCSCISYAQPARPADSSGPDFVNIIHIINKEASSGVSGYGNVPYEALENEVSFLTGIDVKATFFMQYDALGDKGYTDPVGSAVSKGSEAGAFWHPTHALVKKAGVAWKGESLGDMLDGSGFTGTYSDSEKEKMAAVYMEEFKNVFGYYPKSIGSHYTDEHMIRFMRDKYAIEAWFICETETGNNSILNDGFEGVYYPNKYNAAVPAQNASSQMDIPVIRVARDDLGYLDRSGNDDAATGDDIAVAFERHGNLASDYNITYWGGYTLGSTQETSSDRERRARIFKTLVVKNGIDVETVSETARWFKKNFDTTPPYAYGTYTSVNGVERPAIRYNSRFYSANLVWDDGTARLRDIYKFDERHTQAKETVKKGETRSCYGLPLADGFDWGSDAQKSGVFLMEQIPGIGLEPIGCRDPREIVRNPESISVIWKDRYDERTFTLIFNEKNINVSATDNASGKGSLDWMMALLTAKEKGKLLPFSIIVPDKISANICDHAYHIGIAEGKVALNSDDTPVSIKMFPDNGTFELDLSNSEI